MGNHVADRTASHVVHLFRHSSAGEAAVNAKKAWTARTKACIARIARVRDKLPPIPKWNVGVRFALSRATAVPPADRHQLCWPTSDRPMCSVCFRFFRRPSTWRARCDGKPTVGPGVLPIASQNRHNMALFATAGRTSGLLAICLRCGCYSQHRVGKLNKPCRGSLPTSIGPLKRVLRGRHPTDKHSFIQAPVQPWKRSNQAQRDSLEIPCHFLAASTPREVASGSAADVPPGAHGEGDPPLAPALGQSVPVFDEEWDLDALAAWFGT
jgi:hypothetical protein